jgi:hypothetical protein
MRKNITISVIFVLTLGIAGLLSINYLFGPSVSLGPSHWQVVDKLDVSQHPALASLRSNIIVENAVAMGFQDRVYRFQFRFNESDQIANMKALAAAGLKPRSGSSADIAHMLTRKSDDESLPFWWSMKGIRPECMWEAGDAPAYPIFVVIGPCDTATADGVLLGQVTEF